MSYILRKATLIDLPILLTFEQGIVETERAFDDNLKDGKICYYSIEEKIISENAQVLVIEYNGKAVASGFAEIIKSKDFNKFEEFSSFRFIYVDKTHRNMGLSRMILNGLIEWSDSKGIKIIKLNVYNDNLPALNAYLKAGFKKKMVEMQLER
jgi:GNAT superfamily N-acetyltransferase